MSSASASFTTVGLRSSSGKGSKVYDYQPRYFDINLPWLYLTFPKTGEPWPDAKAGVGQAVVMPDIGVAVPSRESVETLLK